MKRRDLIKAFGAFGVGSVVPAVHLLPQDKKTFGTSRLPAGIRLPDCVLIPSETRGPFPLDLSGDATYFRQAINEDKTGVPFTLVFNIVNVNDECAPVVSARVDAWHCDRDGIYSGFSQPGANTIGQTFCRGIQLTDSIGQVSFTTVYPGWYPGRITHIHFEIYLNSVLSVTSQVAFPEEVTDTVYSSDLYTKGPNTSVSSFSQDNVFSDGTDGQMLTITGSLNDGYTGTLTVGIDGSRSTGIQKLEPETGGQFKLNQNYPNPFTDETTVAFELTNDAQVILSIFDLQGRKVYEALNAYRSAGSHTLTLQRAALALAAGSYVYEFRTVNALGVFFQSKLLTIQ